MKIKVEIDCTPAEARQFFGQPDLQPMQNRLMEEMERRLRVAMVNLEPSAIVKQWFTMWGMDKPKWFDIGKED